MEMSDRGKRWRSNAGSACGWSRCCPKPDSLIGTTSKESRSRIFLLGAAGEQEENGLGASASGPARTLTQNVPLGSRVVSQKVNFLGQGNKGRLISSAVRRRTGEYPPARLLLPGGLAACGALSPKYKYSVGGSPTQKYFPFWATPTICTHLPLRSPSQKRLPTGSWFGQ